VDAGPAALPHTESSPVFFDVLPEIVAELPASGGRVAALVPAHNGELSIGLALDSLPRLVRRPDLMIVIPDNCSNLTADVVLERGDALVLPTRGNTDKQAGALKQALVRLLPLLPDDDAILLMDADSALQTIVFHTAPERLGTRDSRSTPSSSSRWHPTSSFKPPRARRYGTPSLTREGTVSDVSDT